MKKRIISMMAILALMFGPICIPQAPAQILLMDEEEEEENERTNTEASELELPAIPELGITWPVIFDAQKVPTDIYGINGIPHIILFGPDGTILARELRGEEIDTEIAKYL